MGHIEDRARGLAYLGDIKLNKEALVKAHQEKDWEAVDVLEMDIVCGFIRYLAQTDFGMETHPLWVSRKAQEILDLINKK